MTRAGVYERCREILSFYNIDEPENEAAVLLSHFLSIPRHEVLSQKDLPVKPHIARKVYRAAWQRTACKPLAYILGYKDFYEDRILVRPGALIPRADTEHLVTAAKDLSIKFGSILEIGAGSGAVCVALARVFPEARITGWDVDVRQARENVERLGLANVSIERVNVFKVPGSKITPVFDLVVSNPPYLSREDMNKLPPDVKRYEPRRALYGGPDGLDFYRRICDLSKAVLAPGGYLVFETDYKWESVKQIIETKGLEFIKVIKDYRRLERVIISKNKTGNI
jgi:release factor glutamine methyltransferase